MRDPICAICLRPSPADQTVTINGEVVGVSCFDAAIKRHAAIATELAIAVSEFMDPMGAYRLGRLHGEAIASAAAAAERPRCAACKEFLTGVRAEMRIERCAKCDGRGGPMKRRPRRAGA